MSEQLFLLWSHLMADIGHVTDASFESDVLNSDLPVLVDLSLIHI